MKKIIYFEVSCSFDVSFDLDIQKKINGSTQVVTHLYSRILNLSINNLHRYNVELIDKPKVNNYYKPNFNRISHIEKSFNFNNYFTQSKYNRRTIILETLYDAIKEMCQKMNIDLLPFTIAYEKVKELNYENKFIYGKLTSSPNRKYKASIEIEIIEEKAILSAVLNNGTEKSQTIKFLETLPHQMFIYRLVHKGKWTSKDIYTVSDKSRQINFDILFKDNTSKIRFEPKTTTIEELQKALKSVGLGAIL